MQATAREGAPDLKSTDAARMDEASEGNQDTSSDVVVSP
jgi:hypothetical protein